MKAEEIAKRIDEWLEKNAENVRGEWKCKRCGGPLMGRGKRLSVHEGYSVFGTHAGFGQVKEIIFPYCPKCDKGIECFSGITCVDW